MATALYERVTDPDSRARLRASWGFCNWHAWMLAETSDTVFSSAIVYEDLLRAAMRRFERAGARGGRGRRLLTRLNAALGAAADRLVVRLERPKGPRPPCLQLAEARNGYLGTALPFLHDLEFERAYRASQGLCVPHALAALELDDGAAAEELLARTLPKWRELRDILGSFVEKHDHLKRTGFTEAEGGASLRAFETLAGASGLFPSHRDAVSTRRPGGLGVGRGRLARAAPGRSSRRGTARSGEHKSSPPA